MLNVLLSFVGDQDPISEKTTEEGSIVTLCRKIKPEVVYLFPTAEGYGINSHTQNNALTTKEWLEKEVSPDIKVFIKPLALADPTDYTDLMPKARKAVAETLTELQQESITIHLNTSSGTPQMKSIWLILANGGQFPNCCIWQVANPKYSVERIKKIEITFLEEEDILARIERYAPQFLFQHMADECQRLKQISLYSYRRDKAALLQKVSLAYHYWDLIRYREARDLLTSVYNDVRRTRDLSEAAAILEKQVKFLDTLVAGGAKENRENMTDLYYNAQRRLQRGDYTDTLARFWRIYEGTIYAYLRHKYGIEPTALAKSTNADNLQKLLDYQNRMGQGNKIKLGGVVAAEKALTDIYADAVYMQLQQTVITVNNRGKEQPIKLDKVLFDLREQRNRSIVAHGMEPVPEADAVNCLVMAEKLFATLLGGVEVLRQYPLRQQEVTEVVGILRQAFRQ